MPGHNPIGMADASPVISREASFAMNGIWPTRKVSSLQAAGFVPHSSTASLGLRSGTASMRGDESRPAPRNSAV